MGGGGERYQRNRIKGFQSGPFFHVSFANCSCYVRLCMCCVPLAGTGEGWVKVVVRKVKKRKREVVLRDRKEEEGKGERREGLLPGHPAAGDGEGSESVAADVGSEYA
jgi:hypothetical protein